MKTRNLVLFASAFFAVSCLPAFGQQSVTCSSDDGGKHYCNANTGGGVQMTNQRSGSSCRQGYSWGYDNRGIWVDHGCRADFTVGNANSGDRGGYGRQRSERQDGYVNGGGAGGQTITCSSDDGGKHYCNASTGGGVQMTNQRSGSSCRQGYSWGYDNRGVWVDHGCRADFIIGSASAGSNGGRGSWRDRVRDRVDGNSNNGGGTGQSITCSSDDGGKHYCNANTSGGVQMTNQRSGSSCRQGYSWGYDNRGVWVDHGCRADFQVGGNYRR